MKKHTDHTYAHYLRGYQIGRLGFDPDRAGARGGLSSSPPEALTLEQLAAHALGVSDGKLGDSGELQSWAEVQPVLAELLGGTEPAAG